MAAAGAAGTVRASLRDLRGPSRCARRRLLGRFHGIAAKDVSGSFDLERLLAELEYMLVKAVRLLVSETERVWSDSERAYRFCPRLRLRQFSMMSSGEAVRNASVEGDAMDIRLCEELVVLSESLSFRKASERLFLTQSTLSKHVAAAEREVGFRIFERSSQGVELTAGGRVLVEDLRQVVALYGSSLDRARACQVKADAVVRVAGPLLNPRIASVISEAALRVSHSQEAVFQLAMVETGVRDCPVKLMRREVDVAVGFWFDDDLPELHCEHLFNIPFGIACHATSPLATKSHLSFDDLANAHMISYPMQDREAYHAYVRKVRKRHGIDMPIEHLEPDTLCFPQTTDSVIFGVFFPDYVRFGGDIVTRPLDDCAERFEVFAMCRADETRSAVLSLFDAIVAEARSQN